MEKLTVTVWYEDEETGEGIEEEVNFPASYQVCHQCQGRGKHDHPAFSNGITSDEWNGPDWSDEDKETYLRGGYDVTCGSCKGQRVVLEIDHEAAARAFPIQYAAWEDGERSLAEMREIEAAERRMGA